MAAAKLSPYRCAARGSQKEGPTGRSCCPQPSRLQQPALGSLVENAHSPEDSGQPTSHRTPTPALGNDCRLPGQPRVPTAGQAVSEHFCATTLKGAAASPPPPVPQSSPVHMAPRAGHRDGVTCPTLPRGLSPSSSFFLCPLPCTEPLPHRRTCRWSCLCSGVGGLVQRMHPKWSVPTGKPSRRTRVCVPATTTGLTKVSITSAKRATERGPSHHPARCLN